MRAVMNEELRKLLGINILYGGDGDAAADDTDAETADLAADDTTGAQDEFDAAEQALAAANVGFTNPADGLISDQEAAQAIANSPAPGIGVANSQTGMAAAVVGFDGGFEANQNADGSWDITGPATVVSIGGPQGTYAQTIGPGVSGTIGANGSWSCCTSGG